MTTLSLDGRVDHVSGDDLARGGVGDVVLGGEHAGSDVERLEAEVGKVSVVVWSGRSDRSVDLGRGKVGEPTLRGEVVVPEVVWREEVGLQVERCDHLELLSVGFCMSSTSAMPAPEMGAELQVLGRSRRWRRLIPICGGLFEDIVSGAGVITMLLMVLSLAVARVCRNHLAANRLGRQIGEGSGGSRVTSPIA